MRVLALATVVVATTGCQSLHDPNPIVPGGPGGVTQPGVDAPGNETTDAQTELFGRVCLVTDLRTPTTGCANTGADQILVTLGTHTAETSANGSFTIAAPLGSTPVWHVTRADLITSAMPFSTDTTVPAITIDAYADLLTTNGVILTPGQGSLIARVVRDGDLLAGAIATTNPVAQFAPFYDGSSASTWDRDTTDVAGTVWITGAAAGATVVSITPSIGATPVANTFVVEDAAITFVTIEVP